jgi:hypothetical protein
MFARLRFLQGKKINLRILLSCKIFDENLILKNVARKNTMQRVKGYVTLNFVIK